MCLHVSLCRGIYGRTWCWRKTANGLVCESSPYVRARLRLKSCWFSNKRHLCHFSWPSWGCYTETADNFLLAWHDKSHKKYRLYRGNASQIKRDTTKNKAHQAAALLWGAVSPYSQGDLLIYSFFALVITRRSVRRSATHQQPRSTGTSWSAPAQNPNK